MPISTSTPPVASRARTVLISFGVRKREIISTVTGKGAKRLRNVFQCWKASTVVGARIATCLPSSTARMAARMATSVLPYPTSPQMRRSIGEGEAMSAATSAIAWAWSAVSSYSKASSNSRCQGLSPENAWPGRAFLSA